MNHSNLHVYFLQCNLSGFKKYLDGQESPTDAGFGGGGSAGSGGGAGKGGKGSSGPKSWTMSNLSALPRKPDPNEKDALGRTVLHLVCSSPNDPRSTDFLQVLLALPTIQVNIQDNESGWTALHRAMWSGNLRAARDLLSRSDTDLSIKDSEGLTAMDLYNSTCEGTNPVEGARGTDLFTWGANRNCTLGLGDPADRAFAEHVNLLTQAQAVAKSSDQTPKRPKLDLPSDSGDDEPIQSTWTSRTVRSKFDQVGVEQIVLGKFHTGVVTSEASGNLSLCGVGVNGRLGRPVHTQYALLPLSDLPYTITSVALAQDHTLALTSQGHIMSWGQNRFAQLGYVIEQPVSESAHKAFSSGHDEPIQSQPKRIVGPLKKEAVIGVAASRMCSACWTRENVWTWGTNSGNLGYDKHANPVQVLPRKVTGIAQPVIGLAITDFALACLLDTQEVLVYYSDVYVKISFPIQRFPSDFTVYRPPQFVARPTITKITSCGVTFAALSSLGDVFSFSLQNPIDADVARDPKDKHITVKPQMVWALRKRFTAVKDVALGSDGAVIICTHSGHVFVRQRANKQWSFKRIPYLQRVTKVAANESGSFAAIRSDAVPGQIDVVGNTLAEDLHLALPTIKRASELAIYTATNIKPAEPAFEEDDEENDTEIQRDIRICVQLGLACLHWSSTFEEPLLGSDIWIKTPSGVIPAHQFILTTRAPILKTIFDSRASKNLNSEIAAATNEGKTYLSLGKFSMMAVLLLLQYIYSDQIAAVWDTRVHRPLRDTLPRLELNITELKRELQDLAELLQLNSLRDALSSAGKTPIVAKLALAWDDCLSYSQVSSSPSQQDCDVILALEDRNVYLHSAILRARCPFFEAMFADPDWTSQRDNEDGHGRIIVDLGHHRWSSLRLVLRHIYNGIEDEIFDYKHQDTLDDFLDFVFEVIAVANELLLDRLVLVCSRVVRRHVYIFNAAALATEATLYNAIALKRSIFSYISCNLETMLENGLLDQMDHRILSDLTTFVQERQGVRLPISRSNILTEMATERQQDWLQLQDIPVPRLRSNKPWKLKSPRLSPVILQTPKSAKKKGKGRASLNDSPDLPASRTNGDDTDIFSMDDDSLQLPAPVTPRPQELSHLSSSPGTHTPSSGPAWKSKAVETHKVDMRSIMAEAESKRSTSTPQPFSSPRTGIYTPPRTQPMSMTPPATASPSRPVQMAQSSPTWRITSPATLTSSPLAGPSVTHGFPSLGSVRAALPTGRPSMLSQGRLAGNSVAGSNPEVIVPTRSAAPRARTNEPAWSSTTIVPPVVPTFSTSPNAQVSLLDIQQQELAGQRAGQKVAPKSMAEIQQEERELVAARAAQAEFDRWWQQEEARVAAEAQAQTRRGSKQGRRGRGGKANTYGQSGPPATSTANNELNLVNGGGVDAGQQKKKLKPKPKTPATARIDD